MVNRKYVVAKVNFNLRIFLEELRANIKIR